MGQAKWTTTNHTKGRYSCKEGEVVHMVGLDGSLLVWAPSRKPDDSFQQVLLPVRPTEGSTPRKMSGISQHRKKPPIRIMQDWMFLWWPGRHCYSLAGKFWFIHYIHQTAHLWISIYFGLYKILIMEKNFNSLKDYTRHMEQFLLKKIKSFGKMELWSCLENGRR